MYYVKKTCACFCLFFQIKIKTFFQKATAGLIKLQIKTVYPQGKGPTYELFSSSRRTAVVPLLKIYMQCFLFLVIFLGWVLLLYPQATSTDHGGPRTSALSIERRRRNHLTTAPDIYTSPDLYLPKFIPKLLNLYQSPKFAFMIDESYELDKFVTTKAAFNF